MQPPSLLQQSYILQYSTGTKLRITIIVPLYAADTPLFTSTIDVEHRYLVHLSFCSLYAAQMNLEVPVLTECR